MRLNSSFSDDVGSKLFSSLLLSRKQEDKTADQFHDFAGPVHGMGVLDTFSTVIASARVFIFSLSLVPTSDITIIIIGIDTVIIIS